MSIATVQLSIEEFDRLRAIEKAYNEKATIYGSSLVTVDYVKVISEAETIGVIGKILVSTVNDNNRLRGIMCDVKNGRIKLTDIPNY